MNSNNNRGIFLLLRGCSGSGKSEFAKYLQFLNPDAVICTADSYFEKDGEYQFNPRELAAAHQHCRDQFMDALYKNVELIICANTNVSEKHFEFYLEKAKEYKYTIVSLVVENRHGGINSHGVPEETLARQESNLRNSLKLR